MQGWIRLPRIIQKRSFWRSNRPFDTRSAFVYLLLSAAHEKHDINFDNGYLTVEEGEIITSLKQLSREWKWSVTKVYNFLDAMHKAGELEYHTTNKMTRIRISRWSDYQWGQPHDRPMDKKDGKNQKQIKDNSEVNQKEIYNKVNHVNNDNKKEENILKFVKSKKGYEELSEEEKELAGECAKFYEQMLKSQIDFNKLAILVYGSVEDRQEYGLGDWQTLRKTLGYLSREKLTHKVLHPYYYIWGLSRQKDFVEKMKRLTSPHPLLQERE